MHAGAEAGAAEVFAMVGDLVADLSPLYAIPLALAAVSMLVYAVVRAVKG